MNIQTQFKNTSGDFILSPNEYEGPLIIDRPCIVDGNNSTLWSDSKPVLIISSSGVTVKNLRVECTKNTKNTNDPSPVITSSCSDTKLVNIEVNGNIAGFENEADNWELPGVISFGTFAADRKNVFTVNIPAASDAEILNNTDNLSLSPAYIAKGDNYITFTVGEMRDNNILYGDIFIKTTVSRRIYITGRASAGAPENAALPPQPDFPSHIRAPYDIAAPAVEDSPAVYIKKGQRISAAELEDKVIKIIYEHKSLKKSVDIDAYIFLLGENEKAKCDDDLIFFGNPNAADNSVRYIADGSLPLTLIELNKLNNQVAKAVVCYSIYGDDDRQNFSLVDSPMIRILSGENELYRFEMSDLNVEKTVAAIEFYRYKGEWKINFIGSGYKKSLKQLCENYGINVE